MQGKLYSNKILRVPSAASIVQEDHPHYLEDSFIHSTYFFSFVVFATGQAWLVRKKNAKMNERVSNPARGLQSDASTSIYKS